MINVILAGGSGTRLWPLSRKGSPKQFVNIGGLPSLFNNTLSRALGISDSLMVVGSQEHQFMIKDELNVHDKKTGVLLESVGKNTAPAIALAALDLLKNNNDAVMLVMPSDHAIGDEGAFFDAVQLGKQAAEEGRLVTFGAQPTYPETGYGYIETAVKSAICPVTSFVEKPDLETAAHYMASGNYFWNTGIFMFKASVYLDELKTYRSDIFEACQAVTATAYDDLGHTKFDTILFDAIPSESIDYAVFEQSEKVVCVPVDMKWNDLGSWNNISEHLPESQHQNTIIKSCSNTHVVSSVSDKLVSLVGMKDCIVVDTKDALLVINKDNAQDIKSVVEELKNIGSSVVDIPKCVHRPWGQYESIDNGARFQVKRITVKPGGKLSVQMHYHRAEHWTVVSGTAKVRKGDEVVLLTENQSIYISLGEIHALENPGMMPLELIEIQTGSYLGEDDIVRFEDSYGRVALEQ
jgi:mannose-1-phosphate guanylyltransferase/mannose-6-phosphate isomerase